MKVKHQIKWYELKGIRNKDIIEREKAKHRRGLAMTHYCEKLSTEYIETH